MEQTIRGILLDLDGTLLDSNDAHAHAWVAALAAFGYTVPFARVRALIGMGGDKLMPIIAGIEAETPEGKQISGRRRAIFSERYLPHLRPYPAARELLVHMRAAGFRLGLATSAAPDELEGLLAAAGVANLLDTTTSSGDAAQSKPDDDIIQAALKKLGYRPHEVLMLGDTPYDIEAAARAGVATVALRCGGWSDDQLDGAIAFYADPADLLAEYDRSPLAQRRAVGAEGAPRR